MTALRIQPEAERDTAEVYDWYESQHPGLGQKFIARLETCYGEILHNPFRYTTAFDDFRQGIIEPFQYVIYYRFERDEVIVYRIIHSARDHERMMLPDDD